MILCAGMSLHGIIDDTLYVVTGTQDIRLFYCKYLVIAGSCAWNHITVLCKVDLSLLFDQRDWKMICLQFITLGSLSIEYLSITCRPIFCKFSMLMNTNYHVLILTDIHTGTSTVHVGHHRDAIILNKLVFYTTSLHSLGVWWCYTQAQFLIQCTNFHTMCITTVFSFCKHLYCCTGQGDWKVTPDLKAVFYLSRLQYHWSLINFHASMSFDYIYRRINSCWMWTFSSIRSFRRQNIWIKRQLHRQSFLSTILFQRQIINI